jgi:hypothetical protein
MVIAFTGMGATVRTQRLKVFVAFGLSAGYISGLIAFFLLPLAHRDWKGVVSIKDITPQFFISPMITLSWLIGVFASLIAWLLIRNMVDNHPTTTSQ